MYITYALYFFNTVYHFISRIWDALRVLGVRTQRTGQRKRHRPALERFDYQPARRTRRRDRDARKHDACAGLVERTIAQRNGRRLDRLPRALLR